MNYDAWLQESYDAEARESAAHEEFQSSDAWQIAFDEWCAETAVWHDHPESAFEASPDYADAFEAWRFPS